MSIEVKIGLAVTGLYCLLVMAYALQQLIRYLKTEKAKQQMIRLLACLEVKNQQMKKAIRDHNEKIDSWLFEKSEEKEECRKS